MCAPVSQYANRKYRIGVRLCKICKYWYALQSLRFILNQLWVPLSGQRPIELHRPGSLTSYSVRACTAAEWRGMDSACRSVRMGDTRRDTEYEYLSIRSNQELIVQIVTHILYLRDTLDLWAIFNTIWSDRLIYVPWYRIMKWPLIKNDWPYYIYYVHYVKID